MPTPRLTQIAELAASGDKDALDDFVLEAPSSYLEQFDTPEGAAEAYLNKARKEARGSQPQEGADPTPGTPAQPMSSMPGLADARNAINDYASSAENSPFTGLEDLAYVDEGQDLRRGREQRADELADSKRFRAMTPPQHFNFGYLAREAEEDSLVSLTSDTKPFSDLSAYDQKYMSRKDPAYSARLYLRSGRLDDAKDLLEKSLSDRSRLFNTSGSQAYRDDLEAMLRVISLLQNKRQEDLANRRPDLSGE